MNKKQRENLLECAASLLSQLPTSLVRATDPDLNKLSRKDVVGTSFASMLIGVGISPYDFKPSPVSESYLRQAHSHTSEMSVWHFHSSTRADKDAILENLKTLLLQPA